MGELTHSTETNDWTYIRTNMNYITEEFTFDNLDYLNDYENVTEEPPDGREYICVEENPLLLFRTVFQPLVYGVVFLLGLMGNTLLMIILLKRWKNLRMTDIYLLHLALADLLLLFTFPFAVTQGISGWPFGTVLCKLIGLINRLNLVCGSLLLAYISFDRYVAIVHAIPSLQRRQPRSAQLTCLSLWLFSFFITSPNIVFLSVKGEDINSTRLSCAFNNHGIHGRNWMLASRFLTHLCFFLPLVVMGYCYTFVVITLCQKQRSLEKQGAIRLALLITIVFCMSWLPYNVAILMDTLRLLGGIPEQSCSAHASLNQALIVTESIGFSHCCVNPILYAFIGVRFRRDLLQLFRKTNRLSVENLNRVSVTETITTTP
ncbi:hypothetical protein DNTS_010038 [Danionella cerebrum]|uniref:G-protein coupled receptors family 1 profile domain-containing protein n=1 Tax=Danionella cerebrum TaxID=2873325 RepID=A0A553QWL1_9TELE|nr:hypothetical protein DNTS_010038 [Danionella translucida]